MTSTEIRLEFGRRRRWRSRNPLYTISTVEEAFSSLRFGTLEKLPMWVSISMVFITLLYVNSFHIPPCWNSLECIGFVHFLLEKPLHYCTEALFKKPSHYWNATIVIFHTVNTGTIFHTILNINWSHYRTNRVWMNIIHQRWNRRYVFTHITRFDIEL